MILTSTLILPDIVKTESIIYFIIHLYTLSYSFKKKKTASTRNTSKSYIARAALVNYLLPQAHSHTKLEHVWKKFSLTRFKIVSIIKAAYYKRVEFQLIPVWKHAFHFWADLHLKTFFKNTIILFVVSAKICVSSNFNFSWGDCKSQEKLKTMLMQNFWKDNKEYYGIVEKGLFQTRFWLAWKTIGMVR